MRKLTRRSYNRKLLVFGLSMFMAVAMISTGFAAWVMSSSDPADTKGGVTVGVVQNDMMLIKIEGHDEETGKLNVAPLLFDAKKDDNTGRVKALPGSEENLSFTVSGYVTNASNVSNVIFTIKLPEGLRDAVKQTYIEITSEGNYDKETGVLTHEVPLGSEYAEKPGSKTFTYTLTFAWGDYFGGLNPSEFYDSTEKKRIVDEEEVGDVGADIDPEVMEEEMEDFAEALRGGLTADGEEPVLSYSGNIDITVSLPE